MRIKKGIEVLAYHYKIYLLERWRKKKQFDKIIDWFCRTKEVFETNLPIVEFIQYTEKALVCQRCGECCRQNKSDPQGIALQDKFEIRTIAKYLGLKENSFRDAYCFQIDKAKDHWAIKMPCPFLKVEDSWEQGKGYRAINKCQIYSVRPIICQFYPMQQPVFKLFKDRIEPTITLSPHCPAVQKFLKEVLLPDKKFSFRKKKGRIN